MSQDASNQDTKEPLFSWNFILAILINLCITTVFFTLVTAMAVYAASEFGAGETAAGFAASAFVVGALAARFFAGKYVNTLGRKPILVICLLIFTLASVGYPVISSYEWLITLRIFHGIALGFGQTALTAAVFDIIPRSRRGEGSGYYLLANSLPPALGPLAAIQLSAAYGYSGMFSVVSLISAIAFLFACLVRTPEVKQPGTPLRERLRLGPSDVIEPRAFSIALVAMLLGITFASVMTFLNGYAQSLGMTDAASIYFVVYAATMLVARLFMGRVQDRFGDNVVIMPALGAFIVSMSLLAWSPNQAVMVAAGVLAGFGFGAMLPAIQAIIASKLRTHRISIGISTFFIMMDLGFGFAPLALGPVVESFGYQVMYAGCAGVVVATLGLYWLVHGKFSVRQGVARRRARRWVNEATGVMPLVQQRKHDDATPAPRASTPSV
ncbi:MFS transporter [Nesterenkonia ebinurensis]|uniref:MFS transporter n=1 Tax=Nesterenkonia ebinurensis TaxID=2608252 RepID=UPI00123CAE91|nr:MFS transporter [Nesterenkonia ebinurensis]